MAYQKDRKLIAGIAFRPEVLAYLDALSEREGRTRSNLINQLAREHAIANGVELVSASKTREMEALDAPK